MKTNHESKLYWVILSSSAGMLDFYDFVLMATLFPYLSHAIIPQSLDPPFAFITLWILGYLGRPLGALFFAPKGDTKGRAHLLINMSFLSALPMLLIGFFPRYSSLGNWGGYLLLAVRWLQSLIIGSLW